MDATLHTILATGLVAGSFYLGKYYGQRETVQQFIGTLLDVFKAESLEITEECELFVTDENGKQRKVS